VELTRFQGPALCTCGGHSGCIVVRRLKLQPSIYRNKDLVEKAFGNLKERLNFNRTAVSSDQSLDGKLLFVEFIALIYLSYLKKKMQDKNLFKKYTMLELLDEFDIIECFEYPGRDPLL